MIWWQMMDLSQLFEPVQSVALFASVRGELEAVRDRRKLIAYYPMSADAINDGDASYTEILGLALEFGLSVIHRPLVGDMASPIPEVSLFVLHPEQTWRVSALMSLHRLMCMRPLVEWSDGLEYLENYLLGYTEEQRRNWMKLTSERRLGWRGQTFQILVGDSELGRLRFSGMRCFDRSSDLAEVTPFFHRGRTRLAQNCLSLLPEGTHICRLAVKNDLFTEIFGGEQDRGSDELIVGHFGCDVEALNCALESRIQLWSQVGWC